MSTCIKLCTYTHTLRNKTFPGCDCIINIAFNEIQAEKHICYVIKK